MHLLGNMEINREGMLKIGDVSARELAENFGTPLLVMDEQEIEDKADAYCQALQEYYPGNFQVLYASKAFANRTLFKIMENMDFGLDIVSGGELFRAQKVNFPAETIYFHGNNKTPSEIDMAFEYGIGGFFLDNFQEASLLNEKAAAHNQQTEVMIRVKPGIKAHTHEYMMTGQLHSKFGVGIENGRAYNLIKKIMSYDNLHLTGLHAHIGSQIYETEAFEKLIEIIFAFMNEVRNRLDISFSRLNLGGGLGIKQAGTDPEISITNFIALISEKIKEIGNDLDYPLPELILEPGRSIIGTAGTTLYTVGNIKKVDESKKYVSIDGGMSDNIRPALYDAEYSAFLANKADRPPTEVVTIAGKCCETGDILIEDVELSGAESGDILAVPATGAYTYALANNYNEIPRPAVVLVKAGNTRVIEQRETYEDLIRRDIVPPEYRD